MNRIVPGILLAACWLLLLLYGSFLLFWLAVVGITMFGSYEYLKMVMPKQAGEVDCFLLSFLLSLPAILSGLWHEDGLSGGLFMAAFFSLCYVLANYGRFTDSFVILSRLVFGAAYVGFCSAHLVLLHLLPEGNVWLIILVALTAGSDSGAYYSGKLFGSHKLCPSVSPNKTVEGAIGGVLSGLGVAMVIALFLLDRVNWAVLIPVAVTLIGVGIIGDLCESIVKRGTNTKDSGKILLGHGGILDRIDSLILAAPFLYYLQIFAGSI